MKISQLLLEAPDAGWRKVILHFQQALIELDDSFLMLSIKIVGDLGVGSFNSASSGRIVVLSVNEYGELRLVIYESISLKAQGRKLVNLPVNDIDEAIMYVTRMLTN